MGASKQIISFLVLILFGIVFLGVNTRYAFGTLADPGSGVFPLVAGLSLVALACWELFQATRPLKGEARKVTGPATAGEGKGAGKAAETKVFLLIFVIALYIAGVQRVGFLTSTFVLVLTTSRLSGARDWSRPVLLGLGILLFCYLLFEVWLKLALPRGWLI